MTRALAALAVILSLNLSLSAAATAPMLAGRVCTIHGLSTDSQVMRGTKPVSVVYDMPLLNGDTIVVGGRDAALGIRFVDGRVETITRTRSPFAIQSAATAPDPIMNFLRGLWEDVTRSHDLGVRSSTVRGPADSESLSLDTPGLLDGRARIATGRRHFALEWTGGKAPYRVALRDAGGAVLADETGLPTLQLTISSRLIDFRPGAYRVEVSDATGAVQRGSFSAVTAIAGASASPTTADANEQAVRDGASLVAMRDPALAYEAYLRLFPAIHVQDGRAQALADYIARGAPHGDPPP